MLLASFMRAKGKKGQGKQLNFEKNKKTSNQALGNLHFIFLQLHFIEQLNNFNDKRAERGRMGGKEEEIKEEGREDRGKKGISENKMSE